MLEDLSKYKHSKDYLLYKYVNERLDLSLSSYSKDLAKSAEYLQHRNEVKLMRKISKYDKNNK